MTEQQAEAIQIAAQDVIMTLLMRAREIMLQAAQQAPPDAGRGYNMALERTDEAALWISTTYDAETSDPNPAVQDPSQIWTPNEGGETT